MKQVMDRLEGKVAPPAYVIEPDLADLLTAGGGHMPPAPGKHVSLIRRTNNTMFPTISNHQATEMVAPRALPPVESPTPSSVERATGKRTAPPGLICRQIKQFLSSVQHAWSDFGLAIVGVITKVSMVPCQLQGLARRSAGDFAEKQG